VRSSSPSYNFFDPKLIEIGALPSPEAARRPTGLRHRRPLQPETGPPGDVLEDDHMRATHLIVSYGGRKRLGTGAAPPSPPPLHALQGFQEIATRAHRGMSDR